MTAGLNVRFNIWRISNEDDDEVGGAVLTGTIVYRNVRGSFQSTSEEQLLLQQGIETNLTYNAIVIPGTLDIREYDELQVSYPPNHPFYSKRFGIISTKYSNFNAKDNRSYLMLTLTRSERSHREQ